jgi:16S rRNA (guanine966-N2)-methyltransferase
VRIAGGKLKGRPLHAPAGRATRPTSDRVRQAIFNVLVHGIDGFTLDGGRVLDLFAGTGAMGLEALSRGARFALFVDEQTSARAAIRRNAEALGVLGQVKIWRRNAARLGPCAPLAPFGLAFIDPPYGRGLAEAALVQLVAGGWLEPGAVVVVEEAGWAAVAAPQGLTPLDDRVYGDTQVMFLRRCSPSSPRKGEVGPQGPGGG